MQRLRKKQVAARLGCSTGYLQKLINRGDFPPADARLGDAPNAATLWLESTVDAHIERDTASTDTTQAGRAAHIAKLNRSRVVKRQAVG